MAETNVTEDTPGRKYLKNIYRIFGSHIGLIVILTIYTFIGGAIFQALEGPHETKEKHDIVELREGIITDLWADSQNGTWSEEEWSEHLRDALKGYEGQLQIAFAHGINTDSEESVWDLWGSMFFCATIYTTIGYGHIAPATDAGRIASMLYAIVGIPLCLIVMAELGKLFTRCIKLAWAHTRRLFTTGSCTAETRTAPAGEATDDSSEVVHGYVVDEEFNLPPIVAILIAVIYIFIGAAMYTIWETEWSYLDAFYFIFISISTIGFGDVLPDHPRYFLLSSLYVLVGLALVAMVINVIMEVVSSGIDKAKVTVLEVSKSMGISDIFEEEEEKKKKEQ